MSTLPTSGVSLVPVSRFRPSQLWSPGLHFVYCALIVAHNWAADVPLYVGLAMGAGFLLFSAVLAWVRGHASDRARRGLVGFLAPIACLCWGAACSPHSLLMLLGAPGLCGSIFALGLGPWAVAWAIGGAEFRPWLGEMRLRLLICAGLTWALFLIPHVFFIIALIQIVMGLSLGWAAYLAIVTGLLLTRAAARLFALLDDAAAGDRLNRARGLVLKAATAIVLLLLAFPPWRVEEQVWRGSGPLHPPAGVVIPPGGWPPLPVPAGAVRLAGGRPQVGPGPLPPTLIADDGGPRYAPPRTSYEPWYMCFYREPVQRAGDEVSAPPPLERAPASEGERIYVRYTQPNRRLSLDARRWLMAPALAAVLTAGLLVVFRNPKAATS